MLQDQPSVEDLEVIPTKIIVGGPVVGHKVKPFWRASICTLVRSISELLITVGPIRLFKDLPGDKMPLG